MVTEALSASPSAPPVLSIITFKATPTLGSLPAAGPGPRSVDVSILVKLPFSLQAPASATLYPCTSVSFPVTLIWDSPYQAEVDLSVTGLPADVQYSFTPPSITTSPQNGFSATVVLQLNLTDSASFSGLVTIVATSGAVSSTVKLPISTRMGSIDGISPATAVVEAPQSLRHGTQVELQGAEFMADCSVQFGNQLALATPWYISPDGTDLKVQVPRLGTTGPITIVSPCGCSITSPINFTVNTYRNTFGFAFDNSIPFQNEVGGYSLGDFRDFYGAEQFVKGPDLCSVFCFPCTCTGVPVGLPDPWAVIVLDICDHELGKDGQCVGFCDASLRCINREARYSDYPWQPAATFGSV